MTNNVIMLSSCTAVITCIFSAQKMCFDAHRKIWRSSTIVAILLLCLIATVIQLVTLHVLRYWTKTNTYKIKTKTFTVSSSKIFDEDNSRKIHRQTLETQVSKSDREPAFGKRRARVMEFDIETLDRLDCGGKVFPAMRNKTISDEENVYVPRQTNVNPMDFEWFYTGDNVCTDIIDPTFIITVQATILNIESRNAIRKTWGSIANTQDWVNGEELEFTTQMMFIFGKANSEEENYILKEESDRFGDIVQADFVESYFNLTYKTMSSVRWAAEFCSGAKYLVKIDQDMFLHVPHLMTVMRHLKYPDCGFFAGLPNENAKVFRSGKNAVEEGVFPFDFYPLYVWGCTYVMPMNIADVAFGVAEFLPFMNNEDVFLTGIVRTVLGVDVFGVQNFAQPDNDPDTPCQFVSTLKVATHGNTAKKMLNIWETLSYKQSECRSNLEE